MDRSKLSDYLLLLKCLVDSRETLFEYQMKVEGLFGMVLERDLIDYPALKLHSYLMRALSDSVESTISFTEDISGILNTITTLLMEADGRVYNALHY